MIIDTHCHLDYESYYDDIKKVLLASKEQNVEKFIIPGADIKTLNRAIELSEKYESVYFSVGVHPYDLEGFDIKILKEHINHPKCIAVGECGLDYYRLPKEEDEIEKTKTAQKEVFISQIELAIEFRKPLIVHIRDASNDSKEILLKYASKATGVLHCYNADEQLLSLAKNEFYYGIGGVLTFKNAKKLVNVLPKIPLDRLVIETDAPFLTPHPHRGERNEPKYTVLVAEKMAEILDKSFDDICKITTHNAKRLFKEL